MCLIDNHQLGLFNRLIQNLARPGAGGQQHIIIQKRFFCMIQVQLAHPVFTGQCAFQLFQQHQPVTQDNNLFTSIELFDDFTGENGFASPGRSFDNETPMRFQNIGKTVNNILLPTPELHADLYLSLFTSSRAHQCTEVFTNNL